MEIKQIFAKPIDRPIEGVIKADYESSLAIEVEEYVLTNEVKGGLNDLLQAYNANNAGTNGVWISGFFGSGKSHLLKMLAMLLENRKVNGEPVLEGFLAKCGDDEFLKAELKKAVAVPCRSILFNIDQKADLISKKDKDALLSVFVKVFDELCGYYGRQGHIAEFERVLDRNGHLQAFRQAYEEIAGKSWEKGREQALLEGKHISRAYALVTDCGEDAAKGILDKYRNEYCVSIEDFANNVKEYLDHQSPGFRLNFFVDEIGQFIANNTGLMTNLQTISESLSSICKCRAWLFVTAQEELDRVVGRMDAKLGNDFSKIQDRFRNRLKLSSNNVDEVIQKRLLAKNEDARPWLSGVYNRDPVTLRTTYEFTGLSTRTKAAPLGDEDTLAAVYPFLPYQFGLFQAAIKTLSAHEAFEGRHSSVGERSMLAVFQRVVKMLANEELGVFATFDQLFMGIRPALKTTTQRVLYQAEKDNIRPRAMRILKSLYLLKYVPEFDTTQENIRVLVTPRPEPLVGHRQYSITEDLTYLVDNGYIQVVGGRYEYLTDDEKDVENEIAAIDVDSSIMDKILYRVVFEEIVREQKFCYSKLNRCYAVERLLNDQASGKKLELHIRLLTPGCDQYEDVKELARRLYDSSELVLRLPYDAVWYQRLLLICRTEQFLNSTLTAALSPTKQSIVSAKSKQHQDLRHRFVPQTEDLLKSCEVYVKSIKRELNPCAPKDRMTKAVELLIDEIYPNIAQLFDQDLTGEHYRQYLTPDLDLLNPVAVKNLPECQRELFSRVQRQNQSGMTASLKWVIDYFAVRPYGWPAECTVAIVAILVGRGKLEVRKDIVLNAEQFLAALDNSSCYKSLVLRDLHEFTPQQVRDLDNLYRRLFNAPPLAKEAKALASVTREKFKEQLAEFERLYAKRADFPFTNDLEPAINQWRDVVAKPYEWYFSDLPSRGDELFDLKENVAGPMVEFMNGSRRQIYDQAHRFWKEQEGNLVFVDCEERQVVRACLDDNRCYVGKGLNQVKLCLERLSLHLNQLVQQEINQAVQQIEKHENELKQHSDYALLNSADERNQLAHQFAKVAASIRNSRTIANIRLAVFDFERNKKAQIYTLLSKLAANNQQPPTAEIKDDPVKPPVDFERRPAVVPVEYVAISSINVGSKKSSLDSPEELDEYLAGVRRVYFDVISSGKRIKL